MRWLTIGLIEVDGDRHGWLAQVCIAGITATGDDKRTEEKEEKDSSAFQINRIRDVCFSVLPELQSHMARITLTIS